MSTHSELSLESARTGMPGATFLMMMRDPALFVGGGWYCGCMLFTHPAEHRIQFLESEGPLFKGEAIWTF